jgi:hypothetical protein
MAEMCPSARTMHPSAQEVIPIEIIQTTFRIEFQETNSMYSQTGKLEMNWIPIDSIPTNSNSRKWIQF